MTWMKKHCWLAIAILCYLAIASTFTFAQGNEDLAKMSQDANQWVIPLGDYSGTRHSSLNQINAQNAWKLKVAWTMSTGALRGHEGQPLVVGKMMYFESAFPNYVYAIDLDTYWRIVWKFTPQQDKLAPSVACCDLVNRGLAYANGKILMTTLDAKVYALDAKTGKVLWTAQNGDPKLGQTMTGAPLIIRDKVLVGISGGEYGVRGYVSAFNLETGNLVWRGYSVGPDSDILVDPAKTVDGATQRPVGANSSLKTWENEEWKLGGGTTWGWYTYDPQLNLFYYGSGNPGTWNPTQRPGDNKWSMTIFARNPDTGMASWVYQMTPHDGWDYDGINESVLTQSQIGGADPFRS
jgi:PQQ-dependent dehydrogenase (methanol/ethanol family)